MKANELRIGNYIGWRSGNNERLIIGECYEINDSHIAISLPFDKNGNPKSYGKMSIKGIEPVPLTPEILEKCRAIFSTYGEISIATKTKTFVFERYHLGYYYTGGEGCQLSEPFIYLHQLQNLCFALTGEELEINL